MLHPYPYDYAPSGRMYREEDVEKALHAYASQAVRLALEEVGSLAAYRPTYIDKSSILSLADSIIGKLK